MNRKIAGSQFATGKGSGMFRHLLLRLGGAAGVVLGVVLVVAFLVTSPTVAADRGSHSADAVHFFQGVKTCHQNSAVPFVVCVITTSNVALLQNASIAYVSDPVVFSEPSPGRVDSDVVLTTTEPTPSEAYGHCTLYFATGDGVCIFAHGTRSLAGFNATFVIGTISATDFSVIGKYSFADD
jgi:hypothetical protein